MTLLVPQKKIPMCFWWEWSDIVYDQMGIVGRTLGEYGRAKEAAFFRRYRAELKELWLETHERPDNNNYRHNYATIYRRFLRELPVTARTLQDLLDEDWRGGFADTPPEMRGGYAKNTDDRDDEEDQDGKGGKSGGAGRSRVGGGLRSTRRERQAACGGNRLPIDGDSGGRHCGSDPAAVCNAGGRGEADETRLAGG